MDNSEIAIDGWRGAFLARTSPQLSLAGSICSIGLTSVFMVMVMRHGRKYDQLKRRIADKPEETPQLAKLWLETILGSTAVVRGFGLAFLLLSIAIAMTDGYISIEAIMQATKSDPELLGSMPLCSLATQLGLSLAYTTIFSLVIPLAPVVFATWMFNRQNEARGSDYGLMITSYAFASVSVFAAMISYFIALRWPPMESVLVRFALFQMSFFSGLWWSIGSQRIVQTGGALWKRSAKIPRAAEYQPLVQSQIYTDEKV